MEAFITFSAKKATFHCFAYKRYNFGKCATIHMQLSTFKGKPIIFISLKFAGGFIIVYTPNNLYLVGQLENYCQMHHSMWPTVTLQSPQYYMVNF